MASGHTGTQGPAQGVTQPGATPRSEVTDAPARPRSDRDLAGPPPEGEPGPPAVGTELPVDEAERRAEQRSPGQQLAAGEG